jgi:hypothetical protein
LNELSKKKKKKKVPELGELIGGKLPSNFSMLKVTGRLMSQDKKNRNSFPLISTSSIRVSELTDPAARDRGPISDDPKFQNPKRNPLFLLFLFLV